MDFLRLRLPGLHQALRGALDSFSAFVSYLIGDTVPTVEREPQAAEELGEVAAGNPEKVIEEEAQEELEGFRSDQSERVGAPRETVRCQEGSLAGERAWGWRADSSSRPQAERQDTGSREAAEGAKGQEPNAPLKPEAGPGTHRDRDSNKAQGIWEHSEQEVSSGELLRTCEQKEEKEVIRAAEPEMARGLESQSAWHKEPEGNDAGTEWQNITEDGRETDWVAKEVAVETEGFGAKGADKEEERIALTRDGQSARAQGTQNPGAESEDWAMLGREAWTASGREEADNVGIQDAEYGSDPEDSIPEATGRDWVLEEACKGGQQDGISEKRESEARHQTQILEMEKTKEMTEGQIAGKEEVGDQETQGSFEDEEMQGLTTGDKGVSLEEGVQAEESPREKRSHGTAEAVLVPDKEAKGEPDLEESAEAGPEELFMGEKSEAAQKRQEVLRVEVTEGQDPELMGGSQILTKQLEEEQKGQEEIRRAPDLSPEGMLSLEDCPQTVGFAGPELEAQGNWRRDVDSINTQEVKEAAEEEIATGQTVEVLAEGGQESQEPEVPGWGAEVGLVSTAVNQQLEGSQGAEIVTGQSMGASEPSENKASEGEAAVPWEANRLCRKKRLEEGALSLQHSEDTQTRSSAAEIILGIRTVGAEEGPEWEARMVPEREFGRAWHSKGREETGGGTELEEAAEKQCGQKIGSGGSAEEKVTGYDVQEIDGTGEGEQEEMKTSVKAEGMRGMDGMNLDSQTERAEGSITIMETEGPLGDPMLLEKEAEGGLSREWKGETQKLHGVEDAVGEAQRTEIQENDPEDLEDTSGQEKQQIHQIPTLAVPGFPELTEATPSAPGEVYSSWSEALLPGSRLDVSVPRSRVLLSRSSSKRRSRPSLRRISAPEPQQHDPPSPQPQEALLPEQPPLQPEGTSELSATRPEGTPVPARRKVLGHGFGFAHPGMMQELQARLSRPKPQ
ncbi:apolipoprotein B receptor [Cricetulus griseus]|uniref:apolipoprotein B receptor n=1 Tax=Cricetulus griseus TaxID=10029 RepID=UPI00022F7051|nr:apolipoprotein B receptor [Cricetulus griseus]XP_035293938.1 apolipoprotein B receptor [Cricetulus griseus]XP_035293939.1 apolipoprotein B receptor [Cricetulus griseus]